MKHTKSLLIAGVIAIVCSLNFSDVKAQAKKSDNIQKQISVQTLALPEMPVPFGYATATRVGEQIVLAYSVINQTDKPLKSFEVAVFVVNSTGHIKGGEGWELDTDLASNATKEFPAILQSKVEIGDHLVVAVAAAAGQTGAFEVKATELRDAVKVRALAKRENIAGK